MKEKKFKLLEFKEIEKEEDTTPNIKYYFKSLWRKFPRLLSINLIMLFQIIPFLIAFYAYTSLMPRISVFSDPLYPVVYGINTVSSSPITSTLLNVYGTSMELPTIAFGVAAIIIAICALFLFITYGWQNIGATYLTRELVRGRPVFIISDYFYAVKRNFKQGFLFGALDFLISAILAFDFIYFYNQTGNFMLDLMFWGICGVSVIYIFKSTRSTLDRCYCSDKHRTCIYSFTRQYYCTYNSPFGVLCCICSVYNNIRGIPCHQKIYD